MPLFIYSGPQRSVTFLTEDGPKDIVLVPGPALDLPECSYLDSLKSSGLVRPASEGSKPPRSRNRVPSTPESQES